MLSLASILFILSCLLQVQAFRPFHSSGILAGGSLAHIKQSFVYCATAQPEVIPPAPSDTNARLSVIIKGAPVNNALFRAELKKELTFFRGCAAMFIPMGDDTAEVIAEGKTKQILRFTQWLHTLSLSVSDRKPNFQGPNLVANVLSAEWLEYDGTLKGFTAASEVPDLTDAVNKGEGGVLEANSMAGTDESV
mmetsp:Transcript_22299/g.37304  ORF Transcript_22299/g.37304 Transcript_22299/m.37304 type:complete len:193 (-) Transcript_22299:189-767(-)